MKASSLTINASPSPVTPPVTEMETCSAPSCLHGTKQLRQRRVRICPSYLRGYEFPSNSLSLRWQPGLSSIHWQRWGREVGVPPSDRWIQALCVLMAVNVGDDWGVDVICNELESEIKSNRAWGGVWERKKTATRVWVCRKFCWRSTSQPKWGVTARNMILIYY